MKSPPIGHSTALSQRRGEIPSNFFHLHPSLVTRISRRAPSSTLAVILRFYFDDRFPSESGKFTRISILISASGLGARGADCLSPYRAAVGGTWYHVPPSSLHVPNRLPAPVASPVQSPSPLPVSTSAFFREPPVVPPPQISGIPELRPTQAAETGTRRTDSRPACWQARALQLFPQAETGFA